MLLIRRIYIYITRTVIFHVVLPPRVKERNPTSLSCLFRLFSGLSLEIGLSGLNSRGTTVNLTRVQGQIVKF